MKKIVYFSPNESSFILRDIEILSEKYRVNSFSLHQGDKRKLPFQLIKQLFQALMVIPFSNIVICHFAGYSSLLPVVVAKLFGKPRLLIIAGTDAASFPDLNYGNFKRNKPMEWFTKKSMKHATHILPVHESLTYQKYTYHPYGEPAQGFHYFYPESKKIPFSPLYYAYDSEFFKIINDGKRKENSFISIGNMSVATTYQRKGFDLIIELARLRPDLNFTLIGWDGKQILNLSENVKLLPFLNQEEIVEELNAHQYYFQLSLMEGFPNALAEAMLCGCIPIGSNVSGIPFIIGDTGYVLNKHDINELNRLVNDVLDSDNKVFLSEKARERVVCQFNYSAKLKEFERVIDMYAAG